MELDNTLSRILLKVSKKNNVSPREAADIMQGFYRGINHVIHNKEATIIKVDFFGKFIYSEAWARKKESLFGVVNFGDLKVD